MRIGITGPQDLFALAVRRKWWIIAPFVALSCAAVLLVSVLPATYVSETLIVVQPREVPEDFVMDLIAGSTQQRLVTMEQTVLSRTNLIEVIRKYESELEDMGSLSLDQKVQRLHSQIDIRFQVEESGGMISQPDLTSFRISYQNRSPELAQKITADLTTLFIQQDNQIRESQVFGTTQFLSSELEKISESLIASEEALRAVRSRHQFELPGQLDTNLRTLDRLQNDKQANAEALDRYAALRLTLQRQVSETPQEIVQLGPAAPAAPENPLVVLYRGLQIQYDDANSRYTPEHPTVISLGERLKRLEAEISPEDFRAVTAPDPVSTSSPNPVYRSLLTQIEDVETEIDIREQSRAFIESEIRKYSLRVENTAHAEQAIAEISRRNSDLQSRYDSLRDDLDKAQLAESLESRQKGAQFRIVDPANFPLEPSKPDKLFLALTAIIACLAFSIGLAVVIDVLRQRVWTASEVEAFWGAPVLIDIPEILTDSAVAAQRRNKLIYATSAVVSAAAYAVLLYFVYVNHEPIMRQLDPVLQRLIYT